MAANFEDVLGIGDVSDEDFTGEELTKEQLWVEAVKKVIGKNLAFIQTSRDFGGLTGAQDELVQENKLWAEGIKIVEAQARKLDKQSKWLDQ